MTDDPSDISAFLSPLTHDQHAQLGRIALLWGYIDFALDELLLNVLKLTKHQRTLFIGEKPMGPKLDLLKPGIPKIKDALIREKVKEFYDHLNDTKAKRNHAFHGCWGWRANPRTKTVDICARHPKQIHNPLKATDLPALESRLCTASYVGIEAVALFRKWPGPIRAGQFLHGPTTRAPKWFQQWRAQHPVDDSTLDHNWKRGQLPYLTDPPKS
ncbi:hypothetical protein [Allosphingosinicella sp.]|uniref:hypothetical protein n=1 Tax=Allosphingosinicella sp. TaxID=2823234 RepID=UPI00378498C4